MRCAQPDSDLVNGEQIPVGLVVKCPHCRKPHALDLLVTGAEIKVCASCRRAYALIDRKKK